MWPHLSQVTSVGSSGIWGRAESRMPSDIYTSDTYFCDMDSQPKSEFQVSKVGRPVSNFLREGVPSKICFLCYGKPLSTYRVAMILYGRAMPNVQRWMKRLTQLGYLERGESGYQLVSLKVVEEMDRTLAQNTRGKLFFTDDEKKNLIEFLDSQEARGFMAATRPPNIGELSSYDLCSAFSTIFWHHAQASSKRKLMNSKDGHLLEKYADDPRFIRVIEAAVEKAGTLKSFFGTSVSPDESHRYVKRFTNKDSPLHLIRFSLRLSDFMSNCSSTLVEKLSWSGQTALPSLYDFSKLGVKLPSLMREILGSSAVRELRKTARGEST